MSPDPSPPRVLVTGTGGFIAGHCILQLLERGYRVRGTLRNMERAPQTRDVLTQHGRPIEELELCHADLLEDEGWREAVDGCDFVLHVASPIPASRPKHEDALVPAARDGTVRVLRAAAAAGVKRVVLTSSLAAVIMGHDTPQRLFTEADWSLPERQIGPYHRAKTLAERAAWEFAAGPENTGPFELVAINPGDVFGPLLDREYHASAQAIHSIMGKGAMGVARVDMPVVDVRDVAAAHLGAMLVPAAAGQRFCCSAGMLSMREIALILRNHFAGSGYRITTRVWPDVIVRQAARWSPGIWPTVPRLGGYPFDVCTDQIKTVLGWQPRSPEEAVISMAESMVQLGMV